MSCALTYLEDIDIIGNSSSVHTVYKYGRLDHFCTHVIVMVFEVSTQKSANLHLSHHKYYNPQRILTVLASGVAEWISVVGTHGERSSFCLKN